MDYLYERLKNAVVVDGVPAVLADLISAAQWKWATSNSDDEELMLELIVGELTRAAENIKEIMDARCTRIAIELAQKTAEGWVT